MEQLLENIDFTQLISAIWTIVLVPCFTWLGKQLHDWAKTRKIDKYTDMLYDAVYNVVKELYETVVKELKGTEVWTDNKKSEVLTIAKTKIIASMTTDGYKLLTTVNKDFEIWLTSLIEAALYDLKHAKQG